MTRLRIVLTFCCMFFSLAAVGSLQVNGADRICPYTKLMQMGNMSIWTGKKCASGDYYTMSLPSSATSQVCPGIVPHCVDTAGLEVIDAENNPLASVGYSGGKLRGDDTVLSYLHEDFGFSPRLLPAQEDAPRPDLVSETRTYVELTENGNKYFLRLVALSSSAPEFHGRIYTAGWEVDRIPDMGVTKLNSLDVKYFEGGGDRSTRMGYLIVKGHRVEYGYDDVPDLGKEKEVPATYRVPFVLHNESPVLKPKTK